MGGSTYSKTINTPVVCLGECKFCPTHGSPTCKFCRCHFPTIADIERHQTSRCTLEFPSSWNKFKPLPSWNKFTRDGIKYKYHSDGNTYICILQNNYDNKHSSDLGGCQPLTHVRCPPVQNYAKPIDIMDVQKS
jgi:hypothetical protein